MSATQRSRASSTPRKSPPSHVVREKDVPPHHPRLPLLWRSHLRLLLHNGYSNRRNQHCCRPRPLPPIMRMSNARQAHLATSPLNLQGEMLHYQRQAPQDLPSTESANPTELRMPPHKQMIVREMFLTRILAWQDCPWRLPHQMLRFKNATKGPRWCLQRDLKSFENHQQCVRLMLRLVAEWRPWSP